MSDLLENVGKCLKMSENDGKCRKMTEIVGKLSDLSEIVEKCRKIVVLACLGCLGWLHVNYHVNTANLTLLTTKSFY